MKNKNSLLSILAGTVTALAIILSGCSTEDPWSPTVSNPLVLEIVSGPDADTVAYGSNISYSWTSRGGVGEISYQYRIGAGDWTDVAATTVQITNVTSADSFSVQATDEAAHTATVTRMYYVGAAGGADTTPPTVWIEMSPIEGSYVATGSAVTFTWNGEDETDGDNVLFWYTFGAFVSDTSSAKSAVFNNVTAADPAEFSVWAIDQSANQSDPATISFVIQDATILYIDDYQWLTGAGDVDRAKERDQKQFYRDALEGYAIAEWDIAVQGMPDSSYLVSGGVPVYSTIVFASDTEIGHSDGTWWTQVGEPAASPLHYYMESGGNLLACGSRILPDIWLNSNPPIPGDFEYEWLGISDEPSTIIESIDTTWWRGDSSYTEPIVAPDSITFDTSYFESAWESAWWFTWAIGGNELLDLPDSMKIDVAKQGAQDDYATAVISLRNDATVITEVLFRWGLWVDGSPPDPPLYMNPVGHITNINSGAQWSAMLNFDTYSMPLPGIKQTFQAILTQFGE
jgi:hypothetical protein